MKVQNHLTSFVLYDLLFVSNYLRTFLIILVYFNDKNEIYAIKIENFQIYINLSLFEICAYPSFKCSSQFLKEIKISI